MAAYSSLNTSDMTSEGDDQLCFKPLKARRAAANTMALLGQTETARQHKLDQTRAPAAFDTVSAAQAEGICFYYSDLLWTWLVFKTKPLKTGK